MINSGKLFWNTDILIHYMRVSRATASSFYGSIPIYLSSVSHYCWSCGDLPFCIWSSENVVATCAHMPAWPCHSYFAFSFGRVGT